MTARDVLLQALRSGKPCIGANDLLDAYAHELAEQIRNEADADTSADADICTCWRSAADFIDPEANA